MRFVSGAVGRVGFNLHLPLGRALQELTRLVLPHCADVIYHTEDRLGLFLGAVLRKLLLVQPQNRIIAIVADIAFYEEAIRKSTSICCM